MASVTKGKCRLCGKEFGKTAIKNHIVKVHDDGEGEEKCALLKIEGAYNKNYWLYVDAPLITALSKIDDFMRDIWLECCGHLSCFTWDGREEIDPKHKLRDFYIGTRFIHEYDFGSTTTSLVTIVGVISRKKQRQAVRLLARNNAPTFTCSSCGEPATGLCAECMYDTDNPFLCDDCAEKHEHEEMMLPVTNSPRMGVCGYTGGSDFYN